MEFVAITMIGVSNKVSTCEKDQTTPGWAFICKSKGYPSVKVFMQVNIQQCPFIRTIQIYVALPRLIQAPLYQCYLIGQLVACSMEEGLSVHLQSTYIYKTA